MADQKSRRSGTVRQNHGEGRTFVCSKKSCNKSATQVVKLHLYCEEYELPAEVFTSIFSCCEEHQAPDADIRYFFEHNWELLSVGFAQRGFPEPVFERTMLAWMPIEDYEEYLRQHDGDDPSSKKVVTIN